MARRFGFHISTTIWLLAMLVVAMSALLPVAVFASTTETVLVQSRTLTMEISTNHQGHLCYQVRRGADVLIEPSLLGVMLNGKDTGVDVELGPLTYSRLHTRYPWRGNCAEAYDYGIACAIPISCQAMNYILEARAYDDGVAFRYVFTTGGTVSGEVTAFTFPVDSTAWWQDNVRWYEGEYQHQTVQDIPAGTLCGVPMTVELPGSLGYAAVTESALINYSGMSLKRRDDGSFRTNFECDQQWTPKGNIVTPWRVIMLSPDLNGLVNCTIVPNVAPAPDQTLFPQGMQTDWIKPGRCVWSWMGGGGITPESMCEYARLGSELGFEYNLIDEAWEHWQPWGDFSQLQQVVDFTKQQGLATWVWKSAPDRAGIPGLYDRETRRGFFRTMHDLGVAGVKIDFMDNESFETVNFIQDTLADAAEFQLLVDFHGASKPAGESRTWPNELTREGIRGLENLQCDMETAEITTAHPFIRFLAGAADFTPVNFDLRAQQLSWAHHLAGAVIYTSPLLVFADHPADMLAHPAAGILRSIPSSWDETIVLPQSKIGELAAFARRHGDEWFIAVMNGNSEARVALDIDPAFLGPSAYNMEYCCDDLTPPPPALNGIGTHAPGVIAYDLAGSYARFTCLAGLDPGGGSNGSITCNVYGDGNLLFESGVLHNDNSPIVIDIDVRGMRQLKLVAGDAGDGMNYDHVDWADAWLERPQGERVALSSLNWTSVSEGWGTTMKNLSITGNPLRFSHQLGEAGTTVINTQQPLHVTMAPAGGFVARLVPVPEQSGR